MIPAAVRDALPRRPEARRLLVGTLLAAIGQGMTLPFLFIYLTEVRHLGSTVVGFVVAWMGLLSLVLAVPGGSLIDRFGVRRVTIPLYLVDAIGVASFGWDHHAWQAFGSATLGAVEQAVLWSSFSTAMATVTDPEERQHTFGLNFALLNLGIGAGGLAAGFIADVHHPGSFQVLYVVNAVAVLVPALILITLPGVGEPVATEPGPVGTPGPGYRQVLGDRVFRRFIVFGLLLSVCGYAQIEVGYPAFSVVVAGVGTRVVAWGLAANTATIVLAQLLVLRWMHGRSRGRSLALVGVIFALSWSILGLGAWGRGSASALPVLGVVLCAVVFACGETIMSPVMPAITNALAPDELRGRYNATSGMVYGGTAVIGPLTAAPLIGHHLGAVWVMLIVAGSLGASAVALSLRRLLTPEQDGRLDEPERVDAAP